MKDRRSSGTNSGSVPLAVAMGLVAGVLGLLALNSRAADPVPVTLKTTELGTGPVLVFVPDVGMPRTVWMPTVRKLIAGHRIVLVDLPGHGESPMLPSFTFASAGEALDRVLAKQKAESTIVIGQGMGGVIAAYAVGAHPDHVRGLVLVDVGMKPPMKIDDQRKQMFFQWMDENFDQFVRQVYGMRGRDSTQGAEIVAQAALVPQANLKPYFREMLSLDGGTMLKPYTRPALYVGSERGWPADKPWATLSAEHGLEALAKADTARIPASAQLIMKDQPDSLASAIAQFTKKTLAAK